MTKEEIEALRAQMAQIEEESRRRLYAQMDRLSSDERMTDEEREALYAQIDEQLTYMRQTRDMLSQKLKLASAAVDEVETRLKEEQRSEKRRSRKIHLLPVAPTNAEIDYQERKSRHFAQGISFYKLFWVFFIGCFLGVVLETLYCYLQRGHFESRVGLIYGPFNLVYGIGALALSLALYRFRNRGRIFSFVGGFIVGSVIEYGCSLFQELVFGTTSWDYSNMPYNLNGRICLLYSIFWGILGIFWIKDIYPRMAKWILKIPNRLGKALTWALLLFMVFNSVMTMLTSLRWTERQKGVPAGSAMEAYFDEHYPDERMQRIFANAEFSEEITGAEMEEESEVEAEE